MDKLDITTQDITDEFFKLADTISGPPNFTLNNENYKLTDASSEHEIFERRADFYAYNAPNSFKDILATAENLQRTEKLYIALFDSLMYSELCFIEGKPIFNSYYSCIFFHHLDLLKEDSILYSFIGGYLFRLNSIFYGIYNSGVSNHEDFSYSHIPFNSFFTENKIFELIAENEESFKDSNIKVKSNFIRKEVINYGVYG